MAPLSTRKHLLWKGEPEVFNHIVQEQKHNTEAHPNYPIAEFSHSILGYKQVKRELFLATQCLYFCLHLVVESETFSPKLYFQTFHIPKSLSSN